MTTALLKNATCTAYKSHSVEEREHFIQLLNDCSNFLFNIKNNLKGENKERAEELEKLTDNSVREACSK